VRRSVSRHPALVAGLLLALWGCVPLGPIPGGALSGDVFPPPRDFGSLRPYGTIQLETRPADPYSVNAYAAAIGPHVFIGCRPDSRWLPYVLENPDVRLRVNGRVYELRAERSENPAEREAFFADLRTHYDWSPNDEDRATALILKLGPRTR